jgi:glyoxylase I family protein
MKNEKIAGCGFHHVAVRTPDFDGSVQFWRDGMGFNETIGWGEKPTRAILLDTGDGNYLELFEREPLSDTEAAAPILHFCLRAADVDAAVEVAKAAGAEVISPPSDPPVFADKGLKVRIAFIRGPGGEVCEFFQSDTL